MLKGILLLLLLGKYAAVHCMNVAAKSQESREPFSMEEIFGRLKQMKGNTVSSDEALEQIKGDIEAAGMDLSNDFNNLDKEGKEALTAISSYVGEYAAMIIAHIALSAQRSANQNANGFSEPKNDTLPLLIQIVEVFKSQPQDFDYNVISEALQKWANTVHSGNHNDDEGDS